MKKIRIGHFVTVGCLLAGWTGAHAAPSGPLYIVDNAGTLGTVNLATMAVSVIGATGIGATDLAFSSNGTLYATSFTSLYQVNAATGVASQVGTYGSVANGINALVGAPNGVLYAAAFNTSTLYSIAPSPFTISTLPVNTGGNSAGDLAISASGTSLYESQANGNLVRIAVAGTTVTSTVIGNTGNTGVFGLSTGDDGVTYAVAGTEVYSVNTNTAALTPLFDYSGHGLSAANGSAFRSESRPVPEPASLAMLGAGLLATGIVRCRSRKRSTRIG